MIFSSGVPLPRPDRHSQKIYLARLGLSAKRLSSFLALAGRAAVSRLEAVFSLEVQSRCDRRRGRVVACRFCGRALPSRHVRSSSSLLPFSAPFSSHLVSSRLVSSGSTPRLVVPDRSQFFLAVVNGPETLLGNSNFFYTQYQQYIPISLNHPEEGKNLDGRNTFKSATDLPLEARNFSTFLGFIGLPMVFAPVVPAVGGFFLMVAKDRRLEGGHHESTLLDPC